MLDEKIESELTNYHVKKLVNQKYIIKKDDKYLLSDKGKDYINSIDDNTQEIEKQPKTSVVISGKRLNKDGEVEFLLYRRLKHPYFRKIGRIGGKVKFGETLEEAARRELFEETGLIAGTLKLETIYHKLRKRIDGTFVQDVIFYIFHVTEFKGKFIEKTLYQENFWISSKEKTKYEKDFFDDLRFDESLEPRELTLVESIAIADGF